MTTMGVDAGRRRGVLRRAARLAALGVLAWWACSCAPSWPRPYLLAQAAAERAYSSGRYEEAARYYHDAALHAVKTKDRDEMLYLEATSEERAGRTREAREDYEALEKLAPDGPRAARSAYEVAEMEVAQGDKDRGYRMIEAVMRRYPRSGIARRAMQRYVEHLDSEQGEAAGLAYLRANKAWFDANGLGEDAMYSIARHLESLGQLEQARDAYLQCAKEHPYPGGSLWDDALWHASLLDEKLGDPKKAIADLDTMLREREESTFSGSYERPRYASAQMRKAVLYRDALHDHATAIREFRKLFDDFTTSLQRDDALWAEAKLEAEDGNGQQACATMKLLADKLPKSRYVPCASLVCPTQGASGAPDKCRHYIEREFEREESNKSSEQ